MSGKHIGPDWVGILGWISMIGLGLSMVLDPLPLPWVWTYAVGLVLIAGIIAAPRRTR